MALPALDAADAAVARRDVSQPDLSVGTLIRRLRRAVVHLFEIERRDILLGPIETLLLRLIPGADRADADTLCGLAALDMVTFSKCIKRLQRQDLVEVFGDATDRRRRLYRLTEVGRRECLIALSAVKRTEDAFLRPLAPRDRRLFMRLLTELVLANGANSAVQQDRRIVHALGGHIDPGTLLRRARLISLFFFYAECGEFGLTPVAAAAVMIVAHHTRIARADLTRKLAIDRASTIGIVRGLAAKGILSSDVKPPRYLRLTRRSHALARALGASIARSEARFLSILSPGERESFVRLMRRLNEKLKPPVDKASAQA